MRAATLVFLALFASVGAAARAEKVGLVGETTVPRQAGGVLGPIGGLSAVHYDAADGFFYALSDDPGRFAVPRIYRLRVDVDRPVAVEVEGVIQLKLANGAPVPPQRIDPEGLARSAAGGWWIASEGHANDGVPPALIELSADGVWLSELKLPRRLRPRRGKGVRHNLALESATVSPDGRWLYTATESALAQDGPLADATTGAESRLMRFDLVRRRLDATFVYRTEPIADPPVGEAFAVNGLVDLLALGDGRLLALERSYTAGSGNTVRLFEIDTAGARDVTRVGRLSRRPRKPVAKRLVADLGALGVVPDNLEGLCWGPLLADGLRSLVLVADDNFNLAQQRNQIVVLAFDGE